MLKKIFLAFMLLTMPAIAAAQSAVPSDVSATPVNPSATYDTGTGDNTLGDNSNARGGTMPVLAIQPADIPTPTGITNAWAVTNNISYQPAPTPLSNGEVKFRTQMSPSHSAYDDPIRAWCNFGGSHLHTFFGNNTTNACSTYAKLRTNANLRAAAGLVASTAAGGPLNATGYWHPAIIKTNPFGDGKNYIVLPYSYITYYANNPATLSLQIQRFPRGHRFVMGVNMDDPDNCAFKRELNVANGKANSGCPTPTGGDRYILNDEHGYVTNATLGVSKAFGNGFRGWVCYNDLNAASVVNTATGDGSSPWLKNPNGSDPWGGACTDGVMRFEIFSPQCYNGKDLWVPGGYNAMRYTIGDGVKGGAQCPKGWYRQTEIEVRGYVRHHGPSDYMNWRLSSDDMCATVSGHPCPNGSSMHTDWLGGWDDTVMTDWMGKCNGAFDVSPVICDSSTISLTRRLVGGLSGEAAPDGSRLIQVDNNANKYDTSTPAGMQLVPPAKAAGPITINAVPKP